MPGLHAKLSPSGADKWATCTASVAFEETCPPEEESKFAAEGTEAHDLLERAIKARTRPSELEPDHHACSAVDQCFDLIAPYLGDPEYVVLSETKVVLSEDCWGTADVIMLGHGTLHIIDYKHGQGVPVDVPSIQLEIYAAAALKDLEWLAPAPLVDVKTTIVQPRAVHPDGPVRTKEYPREEIEERGELVLVFAQAIFEGRTMFRPSEKACRWCRGKGRCKAQADLALELAKSKFTALGTVETPSKEEAGALTADQQAEIHNAAAFIRSFLDGVSGAILSSLLAGNKVPGLKVVAGRSNRKFGKLSEEGDFVSLSDDEIIEILTKDCKLKLSEIAPPKLLGPAPIEKLIDVKKRNGSKKMDVLKSIIVKPEGKPTVVKEDHPSPSIAPFFEAVESKDPLS